jgi:SEC-C motif-containing protein
MKSENCPCGRPKSYNECCGAIHKDIFLAKTAEDLMRSRYSAFVKANGDYLMLSQHSTMRKPTTKHDTVRWAMSVKWQKLEVLDCVRGEWEDESGTVEFKAYFMERFRNTFIHENSVFIKENGHWVYFSEAQ